MSEQGIYSRSIDITCVDSKFEINSFLLSIDLFYLAPSLDLEVIPTNPDSNNQIAYGSDSSFDITIFTIPRSKIILDITRNGNSILNDKRFELIPM